MIGIKILSAVKMVAPQMTAISADLNKENLNAAFTIRSTTANCNKEWKPKGNGSNLSKKEITEVAVPATNIWCQGCRNPNRAREKLNTIMLSGMDCNKSACRGILSIQITDITIL